MTSTDENKPLQTYAEKLDIPQVTLSEVAQLITLQIKHRQHRGPLLLVGEAGIGKTQLVQQIAEDNGHRLCTINTAQFGLMGGGIPLKTTDDFFKIAVPDILPRPGEKTVLFFDEINRGLKHSISMFFNLIECRRMFNYTLPPECLVIGAMNPTTANYQVSQIDKEAAFRRRLKFLYVIYETRGWIKHAQSDRFHQHSKGPAHGKSCHPDILGFFRSQPKMIYDPKARDAGKQYTCPATIETISEEAYILEEEGISLSGETARIAYGGSIGLAATAQLLTYIKDKSILIGANDILYHFKKTEKALKKLVTKGMHEPLADLCSNVLALLFSDTPKDVKQTATNFVAFCSVLPTELTANMLFQMKETAVQNKTTDYLMMLMSELQNHDPWIAIQRAIDQSHRAIDESLRAQ